MKELTRAEIRKQTSIWIQLLFDNNLHPNTVNHYAELLSEEIYNVEIKGDKITDIKLKSLFKDIEEKEKDNGREKS
jgi:hypothetical protein